jgi:hypothetical protein
MFFSAACNIEAGIMLKRRKIEREYETEADFDDEEWMPRNG